MEIGQRVKITGTNSVWDGKEGIIEELDDNYGTCTVFVDFKPEEGKKVRQDFSIDNISESLSEGLKNKNTGELGNIVKDFNNGFVLFQSEDGSKSQVAKDDLEEVEDKEEATKVLYAETTPSFDNDFNNLPNSKEAEWFLSENESNSLLILERLGIEETIRAQKAKQETISNNNKYRGGVTVYSLFKKSGSSNQFRAYFYRDGNKVIFVRCLLKKTNKNSNEEDKAIIDTINYALGNKGVDKK